MITQTIRIENNTSTAYSIGSNLFLNLNLYPLSSLPGWITYANTGSPLYTKTLTISPIDLGVYYYYFTLGGSPSIEDALLILEVVDSLTTDLETCVQSSTYLVDSFTNDGGSVGVNTSILFSIMPKVNEYVLISSGLYAGYWRVKNTNQLDSITIDTPFISTIPAPSGFYFTMYSENTSVCLFWINREGGRSSYIFDQRKNFGNTMGDLKTFDNNGALKLIQRSKIYDNKVVYKTGITNTEVDLIASLRYSIQAWEYDINTDVSTSIIIDSSSFELYNTKNKFNEISLKYRLATYKEIQEQ